MNSLTSDQLKKAIDYIGSSEYKEMNIEDKQVYMNWLENELKGDENEQ